MIVIQNRLEVIGADRVIVPGCEPTSALSSTTLMRFSDCGAATVNLYEALAAIPGSSMEYQINNGESNGVRKRWLVLPPYELTCPCVPMLDSYAILKELAKKEDEEENLLEDECQLLDQGFCPPINFETAEVPPVSPYREEGNYFGISPYPMNNPVDWDLWSSDQQFRGPSFGEGGDMPVSG